MSSESNSTPVFSIIVPSYNVEQYLPKCIRSLRDQTFSDIEIILVDDGSTDGTPEICETAGREDSRIRVIHKPNGGLSDARNAGLSIARGEYVVYVDADDYLSPEACERFLRGVEAGADLIAGGRVRCVGDQHTISDRSHVFQDGEVVSSRDFVIRSVRSNCFITLVITMAYRRAFLEENDLYFRVGWNMEDWDLVPRLYLKDFKVAVIHYPAYCYVWRENSITTAPVSPKRIHDSVGGLYRWKQAFDSLEDRELRKCLRHELIIHYLWIGTEFKLAGWWVPGMNFFYALRCGMGLKDRLRVCRFEALSLFNRLTGKWNPPDPEMAAGLDEIMR